MSAFNQLPVDIYQHFTRLISGEECFRLVLCGDKSVIQRVHVAMVEFRSERPPFGKFPFSAFNLPSLQIIQVSMEPHVASHPLLLNGAIPMPTKAMKAVQKLDFFFCQSFAILTKTLPLSSVFPNLIELKLRGSREYLDECFASALPRCLLRLELEVDSCIFHSHRLHYSVLMGLPAGLKHLKIGIVPFEGDCDQITLPSSLQSLELRGVPDYELLKRCPIGIQSLTLYSLFSDQNVKTSDFPPNLVNLELLTSSIFDELHIEMDAKLPSSLKRLVWSSRIATEHHSLLPSSLTHYGSSESCFTLPMLKELVLSERIRQVDLTAFRQLEKIRIICHIDERAPIPLPATITDLSAMLMPTSVFCSWKFHRLTALLLHSSRLEFPYPNEAWLALAPTLKTLTVSFHCFESPYIIQNMSNLERLNLNFSGDLPAATTERLKEPFLPAKLTALSFSALRVVETNLVPMMRNLQFCSRLLSLNAGNVGLESIFSDLENVIESMNHVIFKISIPHPFIEYLPSSLTSLSLVLPGAISEDTLSKLPPKIRALSIRPLSRPTITQKLNNAHFASLPASITSLTVISPSDITSEVYNIIPQNILMTNIEITTSNAEETYKSWLRYYDPLRWQGLPSPLMNNTGESLI